MKYFIKLLIMSYFLHYNVLNTMFTAALNQKSLISSYNTLSEDEIKKRLNAFYEEKSIKDGSWINTNPDNDKLYQYLETQNHEDKFYFQQYEMTNAVLADKLLETLQQKKNTIQNNILWWQKLSGLGFSIFIAKTESSNIDCNVNVDMTSAKNNYGNIFPNLNGIITINKSLSRDTTTDTIIFAHNAFKECAKNNLLCSQKISHLEKEHFRWKLQGIATVTTALAATAGIGYWLLNKKP